MMESDKLDRLIEKYLSGLATPAERDELLSWYRSQHPEAVTWESPHADEAERVKLRMLEGVLEQTVARPNKAVPAKPRGSSQWKVAAALLVGFSVVAFLLFRNNESAYDDKLIAEAPAQQAENRFIFLPDSSKVLLRPGSKLEYVTDFEGNTREVSLWGEGYFDIKSNPDKPFIIHTGKVKTRVLGTAFTIKASDRFEEVSVTVQRGEVLVQEEDRVLASLSSNEQVVYHEAASLNPQKNKVAAEESMQWAALDMRFDGMSFGDLVARLERRYDVRIKFEREELAACPVSGRFQGTESLEEVLDFLCATRSASYHKTNHNQLLIEGEGCQLQ
ncbi:FecR family protein [Parapedobacter deserti]|uniref:FecR family protein n=1 Tax=Parapedobacter deserti TaxID=1912957 RepID=A0ABV7JPL3_9SPHI